MKYQIIANYLIVLMLWLISGTYGSKIQANIYCISFLGYSLADYEFIKLMSWRNPVNQKKSQSLMDWLLNAVPKILV